jgi:membrane protein implicated in regulation of membrane protease activity
MNWLGDHAWEAWLGLAILLGVAELFSLDLILLMLAFGAVVGVLAALLHLPGAIQVIAAAAGAVAMLALVRPGVVKRLHDGPTLVQGHEALVGRTALVVEEISSQGGQIRVGGEIWTARPYDEDDVIPVGSKVDVFQIKGATALVHPIPELGP